MYVSATPVPSSTGIPEGCAFSVACMAATSYVASVVDEQAAPSAEPAFYADNWGLFATDAMDLQASLSKLTELIRSWQMQIAVDKSWLWGSHPSVRKALREVAVEGQSFPLRYEAKDLGCDMAYTGKVSKKTLTRRRSKAKTVLGKLRGKGLIPKTFKLSIARSAGLGSALYGSELTHSTNLQWRSLRSAVGKSLGYAGAAGSTLLALAVFEPDLDPQRARILRVCKFWRRVFRVFPGLRGPFCKRLAGGMSCQSGPSQALRKTFLAIGASCEQEGLITLDSGLRCSWLVDSWQSVVLFIDIAWRHHVWTSLQHRKDFDLLTFEPGPCRQSFRSLPPQDKVVCGGKNTSRMTSLANIVQLFPLQFALNAPWLMGSRIACSLARVTGHSLMGRSLWCDGCSSKLGQRCTMVCALMLKSSSC